MQYQELLDFWTIERRKEFTAKRHEFINYFVDGNSVEIPEVIIFNFYGFRFDISEEVYTAMKERRH